MSVTFAFMMLLVATVTLLFLPFLPGYIELWRKQDATPLRVVRSDDVDVRYFARRFHAYIRTNFGTAMSNCRQNSSPDEGVLKGRTPYLLIKDENALKLSQLELREREVKRMLLSCAALRLPSDLIFNLELFAEQSVYGGERNIYRAILADGDIELGDESMLLRWMHANGSVHVGHDCLLHGRVSSDTAIRLESDCRFERLHSPRLEFGESVALRREPEKLIPLETRELPNLADVTGRRWLIDHKTEIPAGRMIDADLVFTGDVWIGAGTHIRGSIKGHKDIYLGEGVRVLGSMVAIHDIYIGPGCEIHGPVLAEKSVTIGKGAHIGELKLPTTISARDIYITLGAVAHGTVWTRRNGAVYGDASP